MDMGLSVPKQVLIIWPKIPQIPQNLSSQFVCPTQKVLDYDEKKGLIGCPQCVILTYFCPFHSRMYSNEVIATDFGSIDAKQITFFFEIVISSFFWTGPPLLEKNLMQNTATQVVSLLRNVVILLFYIRMHLVTATQLILSFIELHLQ